MTEQLKKYLSITGIIALVTFSFAALQFGSSYSQSIRYDSSRSFTVSSEGKVTVIPDIASFSFGVITQGELSLADTQKKNSNDSTKAIEYLKAQGVDKKDITTQSYSIDPRYKYYNCTGDYSSCPPADIVGYNVTQYVNVKARDFAKIGNLLSGVVTNGANTVSQISFTQDNPDQAQNDARTQAIQKAKAKAQTMAQAGGFRLGRLLSIQEGGYQTPYPMMATASYEKGGGMAPSVPIEPGSQDVQITITLVYEIQ